MQQFSGFFIEIIHDCVSLHIFTGLYQTNKQDIFNLNPNSKSDRSKNFAHNFFGCYAVDPAVCYKDPTNESLGKYDLTSAIWVCFGVQLSIFLLLLLHYIEIGCLIREIGAAMGVYYFGMVGAMCSSQVIFFGAKECNSQSISHKTISKSVANPNKDNKDFNGCTEV